MAGVPRTLWRARPAAVLALLMAGCGVPAAEPGDPAGPSNPQGADRTASAGDGRLGAPAAAARAADLAAALADEDLVGQVLMPYVFGGAATDVPAPAAAANREYAAVATPAELVRRYRVGGVILFRRTDDTGAVTPTSNVAAPEQVRTLTHDLRAAAPLPLLVGIDQEYGVVARLVEGVTGLPTAMASGAAADPALTEAAWRVAGTELAALGVNVNFAPVADVLAGPDGGVIGSRSYGSDPALTATQVAAVVRGLQGTGVAATLKHFPGHGGTVVDSHTDLPVLGASRDDLIAGDLPPFAAGIAAGASLVMSGHLDVRGIDRGVPATFSRAVMTDLLRGELGFAGVAVTDALNMAPARRWPPGAAAVRALLAGNDLLLMPPDLAAAYDGLLAALRDGTLPRARLVEAVTRVLTLKLHLAGFPQPAASVVAGPTHEAAVTPLAAAAVTMLRGSCTDAPVTGPVRVTAAAGRDRARRWLAAALAAAGVDVTRSGGTLVHLVGFGDTPGDLRRGAGVTVAMDTPYLLAGADSPVLLATYSSSRLSMEALAAVLAGTLPPRGRSPVAVPGLPRSSCDG
jgi:beta-N-acetylhexosaminidase